MSKLDVKELHIGYGVQPILPPISFEINYGELWALIGLNGAGKTTLLKTLLGLLKPISGNISWEGGKHVGYVPQRSTIDESIPSRVIDLVSMGVDEKYSIFNPFFSRKNYDIIEEAIRDVNITELVHRPFASLSEGQKQRVVMARALASNPTFLVLDEPTSAMDMVTEKAILSLLKGLLKKRKLAVLIVSHHLTEIAKYASHAIVIDRNGSNNEPGVAIYGPIQEVAVHPKVMQLFGDALVTHTGEQ